MDRKTEVENALIYQIRSAAQRVRDPGSTQREEQENRRELNRLGADLLSMRKKK